MGSILGRDAIASLYSPAWQTRAKALIDLALAVGKFEVEKLDKAEGQDIFVALFAVISKGCADKIAQVNLEAIQLLSSVLGQVYKSLDRLESRQHKVEFGIHMNSIIDNLLLKMAENNAKLRLSAAEVLLKASFYPLIGVSAEIERVISKRASSEKQGSEHGRPNLGETSPKHIAARLHLLTQLINAHDFASQTAEVNRMTQYAISHLQSSNATVRQGAYLVLLALYDQIGARIVPQMGSARPNQIELFNKACKLYDLGDRDRAHAYISS